MKILLVEDDHELLDVTTYALRRDGFTVVTAVDGVQALKLWKQERPELVILDASLPGVSGLDVCHKIRSDGDTPIILLSELTSDDDVVHGFRVGADDYVTKPFSPRQLGVRIRAVYRRSSALGTTEPKRELRAGGLTLNIDEHAATYNGTTTPLTPTEFRLLFMLASNHGRVVAGARLVEYVWGYDVSSVTLLKTHVSHLRTKLGLARQGAGSIDCVPSVGYRFTPAQAAPVETSISTARDRAADVFHGGAANEIIRFPLQMQEQEVYAPARAA